MRLIKSTDLEQLHYAATNYKVTQQYAMAEETYRKLIMLEENLFGPDTSAVALGLYNLAEVVVHQKKFDEARDLLKRAVEIWEKAHPNDYLSLLSYTEAVNIVRRQPQVAAASSSSEVAAMGGRVVQLRRNNVAAIRTA